MQKPHSTLSAGQHVIVRDERWSVLHTELFDTACLVKLRGVDSGNRDELQSLLAPYDTFALLPAATRMRQHSRRAVFARVAAAIGEAIPWPEPWTATHARIDLHDWQHEPAIAAVTGTTRLLLADAVGLGKTIEAGLIIAELCARGLAERVLVLTPPSLREQWADELRSRFGLSPVIFDQATLTSLALSLPPDVNPWNVTPLIVSSIDLVKRPEVRASLDPVPFDVLVVDEAHHLTPGSDRGAVASELAGRTPWVVLATATPHSGDDHAYGYLTALGEAGDTLRVFCRAPARMQRPPRRSRVFMVSPTIAERALLNATRDYARRLRASRHSAGAQLVGSVIARRAASSAQCVVRTLERRSALLQGQPAAEPQPPLPWEEVDRRDDDVADGVLRAAGLANVSEELDVLRQLTELAVAAARDSSKIAFVLRLLRRTGEPLIVFSEYRDVALQVASALSDVTTVASIHGGVSPRERLRTVHDFNEGAVRALVATDAAGEGLNLQARCRLVINIELPWTPLRLEQRVGRVDRIGQTRRVHAIHLAHRGSYEGTVIARLEKRRARATAPAAERTPGTESEARTSMRRTLQHFAGQAAVAATETVYASRDARRAPQRRTSGSRGTPSKRAVILVFITPLLTTAGSPVQRQLTALRVMVGDVRRLTRRLVRSLAADARVRDAVRVDVQRHVGDAQPVLHSTAESVTRRLTLLIVALERASGAQLWQDSLFDRRQLHAAGRRAAHAATLRDHLERHRTSALSLQQVRAGESQLVAAWLQRG